MAEFKNRTDAGKQLAALLESCGDKDTVVYAVPRGGVPVASEVARALLCPLDLVITRKIGHPHNPEDAVCAVAGDGERICDEHEAQLLDPAWLEEETKRERAEAARRRSAYFKDHAAVSPKGKRAIIVDDGIATGLTVRVALRTLKKGGAKEIIVAVPCAPSDVVSELSKEADRVVIITGERRFLGAVGAYYDEFPQLTDEEVMVTLAAACRGDTLTGGE